MTGCWKSKRKRDDVPRSVASSARNSSGVRDPARLHAIDRARPPDRRKASLALRVSRVSEASSRTRSAGFEVAHCFSAPRRGSDMTAQGNALGFNRPPAFQALKGRNRTVGHRLIAGFEPLDGGGFSGASVNVSSGPQASCFALSGRDLWSIAGSQGDALGCHVAAPLGRIPKSARSKLALRVGRVSKASSRTGSASEVRVRRQQGPRLAPRVVKRALHARRGQLGITA
jgi:hypothetical protein